MRSESNPAITPFIGSFREEIDAFRYILSEIRAGRPLPALEARAVVRLLHLQLHAELSPRILQLRPLGFDDYRVTHALNVSMLVMALAETTTGRPPRDVRTLGLAGLLHNVGEMKLPPEVFTKEGALSEPDRALISSHAGAGARILLEADADLAVAAVVAYEHHMGSESANSYPTPQFPRNSHPAGRLVQICDIFDALCTRRPFRDALSVEDALRHIEGAAGARLDRTLVRSFLALLRNAPIHPVPIGEPTKPVP